MILYLKKLYYKIIDLIFNYFNENINEIDNLNLIFFCFIKFIFLIILIYFIIFHHNIELIKLEIDNIFNEKYEKDINFSNFTTEIKPIAIYIPKFNQYYNESMNNKLINQFKSELIQKQIDLAKNHGIYGFGLYYNWVISNNNTFNNEIKLFLDNNNNFPFLFIWGSNDLYNKYKKLNNRQFDIIKLLEIEINKFIKMNKEYIFSDNYIRINNKPVILIYNNLIDNNFKQLNLIFKKKPLENKIEIFILFPLIKKYKDLKFINLIDDVYDLSKFNLSEKDINDYNISYYSGIIYKNIIFNESEKNIPIYKTSIIEINNNNSKKNKLKGYSPEKFYLLNKIIIDWTNINYDKNNRFIFINSWNNYNEGNYLEPDEKYGYASINSFSKALFNIPYKDKNYNLDYLQNNCIVAIQAHVYYEELINEIINKTNNIPVKFDLFITTMSLQKKNIIEQYVKNYSNANKYEIRIVENKGRDILPLITQLKYKIKNYKYLCHIHTKKSNHDITLGNNWRNYLYNNLLGSTEIISDILNDFESFKYLGFIFPEVYYDIIKKIDEYDNSQFFLHKPNIKYINLILKRLFGKFEVGNKLIFPSGNMFWAKVNAIHQIFGFRLINIYPKEENQTNDTIMHGIERIWLYLAKLNGYYYKIMFRFY